MAVSIPPGVDLSADRGPEIVRTTAAIAVLTTIVVVSRLISRKIQKAKWNAADYTIIVALIGCWGESGAVLSSISYGLGKHVEVVGLENIIKILQVTFASEIIYSITLPIIKISILLLYRSLFPGRGFAITTTIVGVLVLMWGTAILLVSIFSCQPVNGFWDVTIPSKCINTRNFFIGNSVPNICMDVFILALPFGKVWKLQMSARNKILVSGLFLLGGFVCIVSGVRLYFLLSLDNTDISWSYYGVAVWSVLEVNVAVISACLPTIRPLLQSLGHTCVSLVSSGTRSGKWSRAGDIYKQSNQSKSAQQGKDTFQRIPEYQLGRMSTSATATAQSTDSAELGEPHLARGEQFRHSARKGYV